MADATVVPIVADASAAEATRRRLTPRQAALVERLLASAADEARQAGYDGTTVRTAARRAGVAPATAYTYFASKDHLLAEVLWRRMEAIPALEQASERSPMQRLAGELEAVALFMADDPRLAAACTTALLGSGPEVFAIRTRFGATLHRRILRALGDSGDVTVLRALELSWSGAMLWAGMGHMSFADVPGALIDTARLLLGEGR